MVCLHIKQIRMQWQINEGLPGLKDGSLPLRREISLGAENHC